MRGRETQTRVRFDGLQVVASQAQPPDGLERAERGQTQLVAVRVHDGHAVERVAREILVVRVHVTAVRNIQETFAVTGYDRNTVHCKRQAGHRHVFRDSRTVEMVIVATAAVTAIELL